LGDGEGNWKKRPEEKKGRNDIRRNMWESIKKPLGKEKGSLPTREGDVKRGGSENKKNEAGSSLPQVGHTNSVGGKGEREEGGR